MDRERAARPVLWLRAKAITGVLMLIILLLQTSAASAQGDARAAAREHFEKGVAAFDERRFGEAADEFQAAYRLSPAFVVLYNIGQVNVVLGRPVEAVDAFERYLKQGASAVSLERRREIEAEIAKQEGRIGTIAVETNPAGAELRIDGVLVGKTPLAKPVRVKAGRHTVTASLAEHAALNREVDVAGQGSAALDLALEAVAKPEPEARTPVAPPPAPIVIVPPAQPPAPAPPPVIEKTLIERTYVETPSLERRAHEPQQPSSSVSVQRIAGVVLLAGGLATATVGGVLAYKGQTQSDDAKKVLSMPGLSDADWNAALADFNDGKSKNERGWIVAGVGAAVLIGGVVLLATVPERPHSYSLAPWIGGSSGGLAMNGAW